MTILKKFLPLIAVFLIGALGGIAGERLLFPYLASKPFFSKFRFVRAYGTTIINEGKTITIRENEALKDGIGNVSNQVVVVEALSAVGEPIESASGFLLTGDGMIATTNAVLPSGLAYRVRLDGEKVPAHLLLRDSARGIALLKIERSNLPVVAFAESASPALGETVFLLAKKVEDEGVLRLVNIGTVSSEGGDTVSSMAETRRDTDGSPLFDIEGRVVGINIFNAKGELTIVSLKHLRSLMDLAKTND